MREIQASEIRAGDRIWIGGGPAVVLERLPDYIGAARIVTSQEKSGNVGRYHVIAPVTLLERPGLEVSR